jgi:hypothetical protein
MTRDTSIQATRYRKVARPDSAVHRAPAFALAAR